MSEFESYVLAEYLLDEFPPEEGWEIIERPTLEDGSRPSFLVQTRSESVVVFAKDKDEINFRDVDKLLAAAEEVDADEAYLIVASNTHIPDDVGDYIEQHEIEVVEMSDWEG
ncbi:MAG: hypothetical protein H6727_06335 [Myxococcales bacterium]|nr:hypothetical protein [Myxococcales bacterium]